MEHSHPAATFTTVAAETLTYTCGRKKTGKHKTCTQGRALSTATAAAAEAAAEAGGLSTHSWTWQASLIAQPLDLKLRQLVGTVRAHHHVICIVSRQARAIHKYVRVQLHLVCVQVGVRRAPAVIPPRHGGGMGHVDAAATTATVRTGFGHSAGSGEASTYASAQPRAAGMPASAIWQDGVALSQGHA